jgi:dephospho-CoA kinase
MKVIGLTGTIGAGKKTVKEIIQKKLTCYTVTLSDIIKAEIERRKGTLDRSTLQNMGNELRKRYGSHILAMLAVEYMPKEKNFIIIDGIRNPGEVEYLKKKYGKDFKLLAVDANEKIRFERLLSRGEKKDPKTWEEFLEMDKRDKGFGEPPWGQQVSKCLEMADFTILNEGSLEELERKVEEIIKAL